MTKKKEVSSKNTHKLHENSLKKIFQMKNQYMTQKKTNLSKILINFIKIQKLTLMFKTSLHRR